MKLPRRLAWPLVSALLVVAPVRVEPQTVRGPVLTAAFLVRFAKFTEWPAASSRDARFLFCSTEQAVADAVTEETQKETIGSRAIAVAHVHSGSAARECQVLYAPGLKGARIDELVTSLEGAPVLLVGDSEEFIRRGGIIHLFVQDGTMKFAVNVNAAERAGLRLSSRLLGLARIVRY